MNEEEKEAIKEVKEIMDSDYEYPSILNEITKTNYGHKDLIELWYATDDESSNYEEYTDLDIAKAIVYLVNLVDKQQKEIEDYQILKDDIEEHNIAYIDTPEFEEKYISKDKIKAKAQELDNQQRQWREDRTNKHTDAQIIYARDVLEELLVSGQESDQEGGQEDE